MTSFSKNKTIFHDPTAAFPFGGKDHVYLCIDLKSFYASVECVERGLDPMTTNLVVADPSRKKGTICLAVSPSLKKMGVKNRCRVYEISEGIPYIMAPPRIQHYIDCSVEIYGIYLQFFSREDIHIYSIDEAFFDVTGYLKLYQLTPKELGTEVMAAVYKQTGIPAACGIGTNLYLSKVALDLKAKQAKDFIGILTEEMYRNTLWNHKPLTDFWRIGKGTAKTLAKYGITTMGQIANTEEDWLYRQFGMDAELLIDHAWGREPTTMKDIKQYRAKSKCFSSSQILLRDYSFEEGLLIVKEMMDQLCLNMSREGLTASSITLHVGYSRESLCPAAHGTFTAKEASCLSSFWIKEAAKLYHTLIHPSLPIRQITITCNRVIFDEKKEYRQFSLFDDPTSLERIQKEKELQKAILQIKERYGKNAILRGMNFENASTAHRRNEQIGGHSSGVTST